MAISTECCTDTVSTQGWATIPAQEVSDRSSVQL